MLARLRKPLIVFVFLYVLVYIVPLGIRPLTTPDETRYAEIPREMIESGDWVAPRLNGLRYFEKPPLGYWITALSILTFGENEFAVRLPSAVSVGLTALLVFFFVSRSREGARAGLLAMAVYLTSLEVFAVGITNILDSLLTLFLSAALASFYWAHLEKRPRRRAGLMGLVGFFCGCAFLTKGFLALAVPVLVVTPFLMLERRWKSLLTVVWLPLLTAFVVVLPWCIMIHLREPDFWRYFFWIEHVSRFFDPGAAQHPKPFWFFLPFLIGSIVVWVPLLPAVISGLRKIRMSSPMFRFTMFWLCMPLIFFSASSGKIGTYILPCFPPLAILIGIGLDHYLDVGKRTLLTLGAALSGVFVLAAALFVLISQVGNFASTQWYDDSESGKWIVGVTVLLAWAALCGLAAVQSRAPRAIWLYGAAPLLFMFSLNFIIPESSGEGKMPSVLIMEHAGDIASDAEVFADRNLVHAVCWYLGRSDLGVVGSPGELRYGLSYDGSLHRLFSSEDLADLICAKREIVVFLDSKHYTEFVEGRSTIRPLPIPRVKTEKLGFVVTHFGPAR